MNAIPPATRTKWVLIAGVGATADEEAAKAQAAQEKKDKVKAKIVKQVCVYCR